jgi:hypothetical protein
VRREGMTERIHQSEGTGVMNDLFFDSANIKIHPLAKRYDPWPDAELAELVSDLQENGFDQRFPIIIDDTPDGRILIDGVNRLKASRLAGVEPLFLQFECNGKPEDKADAIIAFILRANNQRRQQNAGQRAIMTAIAHPDKNPGKKTSTETVEVHAHTLSQARIIVNSAPDLVDAVIAGAMYFKKAFEEASRRKEEAARVEVI